jgi:hypothetical protein
MAITLETVARNAACNGTVDLLDQGTTNPSGRLIFRTSGDVEVATLAFTAPATNAFGAAAVGVATANTITDDTNATGGTTTKWTAEDRDNAKIYTGTATTVGGGGDIELSGGTVIGVGATVSVSALTHTQPAS